MSPWTSVAAVNESAIFEHCSYVEAPSPWNPFCRGKHILGRRTGKSWNDVFLKSLMNVYIWNFHGFDYVVVECMGDLICILSVWLFFCVCTMRRSTEQWRLSVKFLGLVFLFVFNFWLFLVCFPSYPQQAVVRFPLSNSFCHPLCTN